MPGFLSIDDAKEHVVVENDSQDELLQRLINSAGRHIEARSGYVSNEREESFSFDRFSRQLELRLRPVKPDTIVVKYLDGDGEEQTFTDFRVVTKNDTTRIVPAIGHCWPSTPCGLGMVTVTATVGFATPETSAPENLRHAARLMVGIWFRDREDAEIPDAVYDLIDDERARRV